MIATASNALVEPRDSIPFQFNFRLETSGMSVRAHLTAFQWITAGGHGPENTGSRPWSDWIDDWAVDFDWDMSPRLKHHWGDHRTPQRRTISLTSDYHRYREHGRYMVLIQVINPFAISSRRWKVVHI